MTGYYDVQGFSVETKDGIVEKKMIIFYDINGKELTREIFIESNDFIIDDKHQLIFNRIYNSIVELK